MKVYDPILCMMVEKTNVKTNDKAGEMWFLYVDGKTITAFERWGAPVKEAKEYMKKNNIKGVGILKRLGRGGSFTITAKDETQETKTGEMGGFSYYIVSKGNGYFDIDMDGRPWKRMARLGDMKKAENNVRNAIGEILSWERVTGKKVPYRK